jgi:hypothetical protein
MNLLNLISAKMEGGAERQPDDTMAKASCHGRRHNKAHVCKNVTVRFKRENLLMKRVATSLPGASPTPLNTASRFHNLAR